LIQQLIHRLSRLQQKLHAKQYQPESMNIHRQNAESLSHILTQEKAKAIPEACPESEAWQCWDRTCMLAEMVGAHSAHEAPRPASPLVQEGAPTEAHILAPPPNFQPPLRRQSHPVGTHSKLAASCCGEPPANCAWPTPILADSSPQRHVAGGAAKTGVRHYSF